MREVRGFNNLGQVVGLSGPSATDFSAFCWSEETGTVRVDLGSQLGFAQDINDAGHIAGNHYLADGSVRAVFWSKETGPIDLPPLPGGATSVSFGMNGHDVVIGNSLAADGTEHTVIWRVRVPASAGTVLGSLTNEVESATFGGHGDVGVGRSLLAKLAAVGAAMRKGQSTAAIHQVGAFVNQVEALHRSGRLAGATADSLEGNAENLIQLLSQN
jgi:uncharacterized membrane protein